MQRSAVGVTGDLVLRYRRRRPRSPEARRAASNARFIQLAHEDVAAPRAVRSASQELARRLDVVARRGSRTWYRIHTGQVRWWSLPGVPSRAFAVVEKALDNGRLDIADKLLDVMAESRPRHSRVLRLRGFVHAVRGNWVEVRECWLGAERGHQPEVRQKVLRAVDDEKARHRLRDLMHELPADLPALADGSPARDHARRALRLAPAVTRPWGFDRATERFLSAASAAGVTDGLRPVMRAYAAIGATAVTLARPELVRTTSWIDVDGFAEYVRGKSVALVANSPKLLEKDLGELIDSHDVVIRFNSFTIDGEHTGVRTDVHVAFHKYEFNLDVPVDVRILISGEVHLWRESVKLRVQPGRQRFLGDLSLRWPAPSLGLVGPDDPFKLPTAGFNMLRLLLHLDVSSAIDLIGFDFYESGMLRVEGARDVPHSPGHNSAAERDWVMAHAWAADEHVIAMKPRSEA